MGFGVFGIFLVLVIVMGIIAIVSARKRRQALASFAQQIGFQFDATAPSNLHESFKAFHPFNEGHSQGSSNLLYGRRDGIDWQLFDYRYTTGSGKDESTHYYGIVMARVPMTFPVTRIRPEGVFDRIGEALGFTDINFESEQFNRRYHVSCADRQRAYDIIHPQMIEYLLSLPALDWQLGGSVVMVHRGGTYDPPEMANIMREIEGFLSRVPDYVRQDLSAR